MNYEARKYWYGLRKVDLEYLDATGCGMQEVSKVFNWDESREVGSLWIGNDNVKIIEAKDINPSVFCDFL